MLARKELRARYYWPTLLKDTLAMSKKCGKCLFFFPKIHVMTTSLSAIVKRIPFARWEIDILGTLPQVTLQRKYLLEVGEYF